MRLLKNHKKGSVCFHKAAIGNKSTCYILAILVCLSLAGCNKTNDSNNKKKIENITAASASPTIMASQDMSEVETSSNEGEPAKTLPGIEAVDYRDCFDGIEGCAVFFDRNTNVYNMYKEELCKKRSSPDSSFKIISTLIGLENGVLDSVDTTMGYDGTIYSNEKWNKDLSLKEAFKESCVWYYRKVIDRIGQSQMKECLDKLGYGNCNISEWEGIEGNSLPALNGFWLESSLEISPKEQVDIIADIFEGKTDFSDKNITILKELMLTQKAGNITIYGKTGTGKNPDTGNMDNGWFVGMFEKNNDERYYFAVRLTDEKAKEVWGPKAKEIALNIINKYYAKE
jgi:bla regulator protein BlaR1